MPQQDPLDILNSSKNKNWLETLRTLGMGIAFHRDLSYNDIRALERQIVILWSSTSKISSFLIFFHRKISVYIHKDIFI